MANNRTITLNTADGHAIAFGCAEDENILSAAESAGYFLPAMCHEGSCGLCHAQVKSGQYKMGAHDANALSDAGQGGVLLCRCTPGEDLAVQVAYKSEQIRQQKIPVRTAVIEGMDHTWSGAVRLTLQLQPDAEFGTAADFQPGQYMEVRIPGTEIRRAYSLRNLPNWDGKLEFLIRLKPDGAFSTWLSQKAKVGDALEVRGPVGAFVVDDASYHSRCMVGGGCGIAPIWSMLRHMAEFGDSRPVHLIFGANTEEELIPSGEIEKLREGLGQLGVTLAVWKPANGWQGFVGTSAEALDDYLKKTQDKPDIYVCGPPKMIETTRAVADSHGLGGQFFAERL